MIGFVLRLLGAIVALMILQGTLGGLLLSDVKVEPGAAWLGSLSATLIAAMLFVLARRQAPGLARAATLGVTWAAVQALALVEAAFFPIRIPGDVWPRLVAFQMVESMAFGFVLDRLAGSGVPADTAWALGRPTSAWTARVAAATAAYVVAYFVAGQLVWPYVAGFYTGRPMPGVSTILLMQVARGLAFTGVIALLVRRLSGSRSTVAVLAGLTLAILGGVAPLIVPNPFMPIEIRIPHLFETSISNFLYGWLAAFLLAAPAGRTRMQGWPTTVSPSRSPSSAS